MPCQWEIISAVLPVRDHLVLVAALQPFVLSNRRISVPRRSSWNSRGRSIERIDFLIARRITNYNRPSITCLLVELVALKQARQGIHVCAFLPPKQDRLGARQWNLPFLLMKLAQLAPRLVENLFLSSCELFPVLAE